MQAVSRVRRWGPVHSCRARRSLTGIRKPNSGSEWHAARRTSSMAQPEEWKNREPKFCHWRRLAMKERRSRRLPSFIVRRLVKRVRSLGRRPKLFDRQSFRNHFRRDAELWCGASGDVIERGFVGSQPVGIAGRLRGLDGDLKASRNASGGTSRRPANS